MQVGTGIPVGAEARYRPVASSDVTTLAPPVSLAPQGAFSEAGRWSSGLFDCFDDMDTCCYGMWCTPCLFANSSTRSRRREMNFPLKH